MASPARTLRFGFLRRFIALGFQLRVLIFRKNTLRFLEKRLPAFFRATRFHAFRLPRFDLCLLIGSQIQTRQIGARLLIRRVLGATRHVARFVSCKHGRRHQHRGRYNTHSDNFNHGD